MLEKKRGLSYCYTFFDEFFMNFHYFECFQKRNSKIIFKKLFLNREIGLIRTVNFVIIISCVQRRLKLLHTQHYQIFWLSESHVFIQIATCGTLTFEPSKKTIRGNALCVQVCQRFEGFCWFWNLRLNFLREKC